jgi:hypothetical protein
MPAESNSKRCSLPKIIKFAPNGELFKFNGTKIREIRDKHSMSSLFNFKIENSDLELFFLNEFKHFSERKVELISR